MKIIKFLLPLFVFLIVFMVMSNHYRTNELIVEPKHIPDLTGQGTNTYSFGLYDLEGTIYSERILSLNDWNTEKIFSLSNYYSDERQFVLLVFVDFQPTAFNSKGTTYHHYEFTVKLNATIQIPLSLDIPNDTEDITIIAFPNPHATIDSFQTALSLQDIVYLRYTSENKLQPIAETLRPIISIEKGPFEPIFLSSNSDALHSVVHIQSGQTVYLHASNLSEERLGYIVIALKDFESIELEGNKVNILFVEPNRRNVYELQIPLLAKEDASFEIIAFPLSATHRNLNSNIATTLRLQIESN